MDAILKVVLIYRKSLEGAYSIEGIFHTISSELKKQVEVVEYKTGSRWSIIQDVWQLRNLKADIYHVVGDIHYFIPLLPYGKTVLTIHDIIHYMQDLNGVKRWIYKWLWLIWPIRTANVITTISSETKINISRHLGPNLGSMIEIIENCHSLLLKPIARLFNSQCPVILHLGTRSNKNLPRLIEALKGIKCQLVIVGELDSEQIRQLIECDINYLNRYNLTYEEICQQYIDSDIVSFVSLKEGFGMPIIEAQASGRPLVTSNLSPMREVAGDGACIVDPLDVSEIREAILKIIADSNYRDQLVERGLLNSVFFSPAIISNKYLDVYRRIVSHD